MKNHNYNEKSLYLHRDFGGKIELKSKVSLKNKEDLSLAYTPGVAAVCLEIARDKKLTNVYTLKKNTVAIVSDGSAVLGLGNLGASASIPVMEGKAAILKEFAGVDAFPICIESQDTEEIIRTIKNIAPVFGGINLEDIAGPKCFEIEERLRKELSIPVMHDDQWGAATVALTGFINALKLVGKNKEEVRVVLSGVGAAGVATARLLIEYGVKNIIFIDSQGVINSKRSDLTKEKKELINSVNIVDEKLTDLANALIGADVFIGLSKGGVVTEEMVRSMKEKAIIFALANPTPEIMPELALSSGAFVVATGRSDYPNQLNNSLVFPGFWRGMLDSQNSGTYTGIDNKIFVKIAENLASHVSDLSADKILPDMFDREVVQIVVNSFKN
jgi:malate dehydrogenase (oxaloacetate-decarboxylating)